MLGLVVVGTGAVEGGVDNVLDRIKGIKDALAAVQIFAGIIVLVQAEFYCCDRSLCVDESVL